MTFEPDQLTITFGVIASQSNVEKKLQYFVDVPISVFVNLGKDDKSVSVVDGSLVENGF